MVSEKHTVSFPPVKLPGFDLPNYEDWRHVLDNLVQLTHTSLI